MILWSAYLIMLDLTHPTWIEIDLAQFKKNLSIIKKYTDKTLFCLPVKANAYGHGLLPIAQAAQEVGVDYLAVAHLSEGAVLRGGGIHLPILVMGSVHEDQIGDLIRYSLEFTISSKYKADLVAKVCAAHHIRCRVHIKVDTGMHRTGVRPESAIDLYEYLQSLGYFDVVGIYSHLATADVPKDPHALLQIQAFKDIVNDKRLLGVPLLRHMANSAGLMFYPDSYFDMVRPSLLSFGYKPKNCPAPLSQVEPCFSLKTKVSYFKVVAKGKGISYGRHFITKEQTRIITIPIGYGDGLRRSLSGKGSVLLRGERFPIVGTICMDQCMVDIGQGDAYIGDEVVLIGKQAGNEISLTEIAELCDTIPYEVLCFFNERIPRVYIE
ncbi:MAG: alanine racemase [Chlamydiae bacterium]|nr:alanine racemase [Chlamydiota bacterium]